MKNKKFWHELTQAEIDNLIRQEADTDYILNNYNQPDWCTYPLALNSYTGCWSLMDLSKDGGRTKVSREYCLSCDLCVLK